MDNTPSKNELQHVINAVDEYTKHLGIVVGDVLPSIENISVMPELMYREHVSKCEKRVPLDSNGFTSFSGEIRISDKSTRSIFQKLETVTHEMVHAISYTKYSDDGSKVLHKGYTNYINDINKTFSEFDEGFTELTTFYIIKNFWVSQNSLVRYINGLDQHKLTLHYARTVGLIDLILLKISKHLNLTYVDTLNQFQRFHINDPGRGANTIKEVLGDRALEVISKLPEEMSTADTDDLFLDIVDSLPLKEEIAEVNSGGGVYKFWNRF